MTLTILNDISIASSSAMTGLFDVNGAAVEKSSVSPSFAQINLFETLMAKTLESQGTQKSEGATDFTGALGLGSNGVRDDLLAALAEKEAPSVLIDGALNNAVAVLLDSTSRNSAGDVSSDIQNGNIEQEAVGSVSVPVPKEKPGDEEVTSGLLVKHETLAILCPVWLPSGPVADVQAGGNSPRSISPEQSLGKLVASLYDETLAGDGGLTLSSSIVGQPSDRVVAYILDSLGTLSKVSIPAGILSSVGIDKKAAVTPDGKLSLSFSETVPTVAKAITQESARAGVKVPVAKESGSEAVSSAVVAERRPAILLIAPQGSDVSISQLKSLAEALPSASVHGQIESAPKWTGGIGLDSAVSSNAIVSGQSNSSVNQAGKININGAEAGNVFVTGVKNNPAISAPGSNAQVSNVPAFATTAVFPGERAASPVAVGGNPVPAQVDVKPPAREVAGTQISSESADTAAGKHIQTAAQSVKYTADRGEVSVPAGKTGAILNKVIVDDSSSDTETASAAHAAVNAVIQPAVQTEVASVRTIDIQATAAQVLSSELDEASKAFTIAQAADNVAEAILVKPGLPAGEGEIRIMLQPDILGGTEIQIQSSNGNLSITFIPTQTEAAAVLMASQPQLAALMSERITNYNINVQILPAAQLNSRSKKTSI